MPDAYVFLKPCEEALREACYKLGRPDLYHRSDAQEYLHPDYVEKRLGQLRCGGTLQRGGGGRPTLQRGHAVAHLVLGTLLLHDPWAHDLCAL